MRYNRIVDLTDDAQRRRPDLLLSCAFPDPPVASVSKSKKKTAATCEAQDDDFVVDDDEDDSEVEWAPMFRDLDEHQKLDKNQKRQRRKTDSRKVPHGKGRRREPCSNSTSSSSSSSSSSSQSTADSLSSSLPNEDQAVRGATQQFLAPHPKASRLSYEERQFAQIEMEKLVRKERQSAQLSGGTLRRRNFEKISRDLDEVPAEEDDWASFVNSTAQCPQTCADDISAEQALPDVHHDGDGDDDEFLILSGRSPAKQPTSAANSEKSTHAQIFLVDEE
jgi:hypothetical protein